MERKRRWEKHVSPYLVYSHWANLEVYREIGDACAYDDLPDDRARHHRIDSIQRHYTHVFAPYKRTLPSCRPDFFHAGRDVGSLPLLQAEDPFSPGQPVLAQPRTSHSASRVVSRADGQCVSFILFTQEVRMRGTTTGIPVLAGQGNLLWLWCCGQSLTRLL
jgi:hypothetical protein